MQRALGTIPADRTAVIITHRLSTVEIADWVLVLEHSQIWRTDPRPSWRPREDAMSGFTSLVGVTCLTATYPRHTLNPGGGIEYRPRHHHVVR